MSRKHEISCWQCNEMTSLETRNEFDGCCWACGVEIDLEDYLIKAMDKRDEHYAALSAVTAERDRLRADRDDCLAAREHYAGRLGEALAEVEGLREVVKFACVTMAVTAKSESLTETERRSLLSEVRRCDAAMAAKEA